MSKKVKSLLPGQTFQNIISQRIYTTQMDNNGLWYLETERGAGESCSEKEMVDFLNSRYKLVTK